MIKAHVIRSSKYGERWERVESLYFEKYGNKSSITINSSVEYQEWLGFGGALTEAAAYSLSNITDDKREEVLHAYFHQEEGLGYTFGRLHMNSCDFSLGNYAYIEEGDEQLNSFSIERERAYVIPLIKDAAKKAGHMLTLLASPWSPPGWMKTNGGMNFGGKLKKEYQQVWANYYVKYIQEMEAEGIPIWAVTVQNEPEATQTWDSCIYTAEDEREFVKSYLGPTFEKSNLGDKKIIIWDHNRDVIFERANKVLSDPEASKYVWGIGNHWYVSEEFHNLSKVHEAFPDKHLLFTEGCVEGGVHLNDWSTGERYARNIIGDMNNWLEGFIDWNIVLNEQGGPNHVGNYCDAPIIVDTTNDTVHYNSSYYYIGHFSRFIKKGAKRIDVSSSLSNISIVAFKQDRNIIVVLLNESENNRNTSLSINGFNTSIDIPRRSITTLTVDLKGYYN